MAGGKDPRDHCRSNQCDGFQAVTLYPRWTLGHRGCSTRELKQCTAGTSYLKVKHRGLSFCILFGPVARTILKLNRSFIFAWLGFIAHPHGMCQ